MHFRASPPSENLARLRAQMNTNPQGAGLCSELNPDEVSFCEDILTSARTFYEQNP